MKKLVLAVVVLVVAAAALWFFLFRPKTSETRYRTEKISRGSIQATITATGTVNPVVNVLVGTQVSGTIQRLFVDFNSPVKKGQIIAQIDPATFEAQVAQARANLLAAKANVDKVLAIQADARRTMERNRELFARNLIARSDLDTAETNLSTATAQVNAATAQVAQTAAALRTTEVSLRFTRIVSPVNGIVVSRNVDVGQTVAASFQTPTLFSIAQDLTKMQINSNIAEADIGRVEVGQPVEFTVDAYPETTFRGAVSEVRNAPITVQNVVTYDVVVKVDNALLKLKPGMTANLSVIVATREAVLRLPNASLRFKPAEGRRKEKSPAPAAGEKKSKEKKEKSAAVWTLENDRPKRVRLTKGISDGSFTELVAGELRDGQDVIVEDLTGKKGKNGDKKSGPGMF